MRFTWSIATVSMMLLVSGLLTLAQGTSIPDITADYLGGSPDSRLSKEDEPTKVNLLINHQYTGGIRVGIITYFCDTFLNTRDDDVESQPYFDYGGFRYDPRQSLFMHTLCTQVDEERYEDAFTATYTGVTFSLDDYRKDDVDLNTIWEIDEDNLCHPDNQGMQQCQFSSFLPDIFKHILNDYSNLKLATLYGYKYGMEPDQRKKAIKEFVNSYFGSDEEGMPCRDEGVHYLHDKMLEGDKKHCSHPKTYNMVDETLKSTAQLVKKTNLLDGEEVMKTRCDTDNPQADLYACAFNNHGRFFGEGDWQSFQNIYLNEWMYYSLFIQYYVGEIHNNLKYTPITQGSSTAAAERINQEIQTLGREIALGEEAVNQMMRMLEQVRVTYPVHVGLVAYMEDLINYRNTVAQLYTPMHQLYYTLRNTQSCQE